MMKNKGAFHPCRRTVGKLFIFAAMAALLVLSACSAKKVREDAPLPETGSVEAAEPVIVEQARSLFLQPPDAVIRLDGEPRWFEFVSGLPRQLGRPEDAGLKEFRPWPQAVHAAGLLPFFDGLVVAVNQWGMLVMLGGEGGSGNGGGEVSLYTFTEAGFFPNYTAAALFYFDEAPAVLLSANNFFLDKELPPPSSRAFMLKSGERALVEVDIPAFELYPVEEGWNIEQIFPTIEGLWYFSARQKNNGKDTNFYGRTESSGKSIKIEEVSSGQFYSAKQPASAESLPPVIQTLLHHSGLAQDVFWTLTVSSKEEGGSLVFSSGGRAREGGTPSLYAAYSDADDINGAVVLVPAIEGIWPEAAAFFYDEYGTVQRRPLPPLPPAFFWTGIGICGTTIVALWEERDNWHIGAAGFLLLN